MNINRIYEDTDIYIEREEAEIPWVKIFTQEPCRELTDCPEALRQKLYRTLETVERTMRDFFRPDKINIASFGNMVPRVHIHVMARYENDSHFPEPMWGKKQRECRLDLPDFDTFAKALSDALKMQERKDESR